MTIYEAAKKMYRARSTGCRAQIIQYQYSLFSEWIMDSDDSSSLKFDIFDRIHSLVVDESDLTITVFFQNPIIIGDIKHKNSANRRRSLKALTPEETRKMWKIIEEDERKQCQNNMKIIRETMGNVGISILRSVENSSDDQLVKDLIYAAGTLCHIINNDLKK